MTIQTFAAGQTLTASQMNTLQASDFNFTKNVQTGTAYTLVATDRGKLLEFSNSGSIALTIPTSAAVTFEIGDRVDVLLASTGTITIGGAPGVSVAAEGGITTISSQWTRVTLIKRTTDDWVITGGSGEVQTAEIEDGAITEAKLATGAVTSDKILDGTIVNADINASAVIAHSKLANATAGQVLLGTTTTGVVTATTVSGDVTITGAGVTAIASGVIVNEDVSASAGIALSKLATSTAGNIIVYNSSGVPTAVTETGDVVISDTGVTAISASVIVDADISASASISYSKLNLANSVATTDLAAGAARAGFRSTGAGTAVTLTSNNYDILIADLGKLIEVGPTAANATVTITSANDANFAIGDRVDVLQTTGTYVVTLQGSGVTINSFDTALKLQGQWACATLINRATNTWVAVGNLTT
jgi:hypothetical protein